MGVWSREATFLEYHEGARRIEIISPDRRKIVIIEGVAFDVVMDGARLPGTEEKGVTTLAELAWSPDSRAFFITQSYGGAVGDWHIRVYLIENGRVRVYNVSQDIVKEFRKQYNACEPNVGAITWVHGSKKLLLVAEVPPHSVCPQMGEVRAYIVEVPTGKIVEEFDRKSLKARWGRHLGQRFAK